MDVHLPLLWTRGLHQPNQGSTILETLRARGLRNDKYTVASTLHARSFTLHPLSINFTRPLVLIELSIAQSREVQCTVHVHVLGVRYIEVLNVLFQR